MSLTTSVKEPHEAIRPEEVATFGRSFSLNIFDVGIFGAF